MTLRSVLLLLATASGCGVDLDEGTQVSALETCTTVNCPGNSNVLGGLGPYELSMTKSKVSSRGFWFDKTQLTQQFHPGDPIVPLTDFEIIGSAMHAKRLGAPIAHWDMVGTRIPVHHADGRKFLLWLVSYQRGYYYDETPLPFIDGYDIKYMELGGANRRWQDLCPNKDYDDPRPGVVGTSAVFWKGDRIDPETGKIIASDAAVGDWFNISCSGDAALKLVRAKASGAFAAGIDGKLKQSTLNMFTAKYCPNSVARHTHVGVALDWDDKTGSNKLDDFTSYEAVWNEHGAVCLTTRRAPEDGALACKLDPCTADQLTSWKTYGHLRSGNPPPAP
ncbi:MAG: hypothetical protein H7138_23425 [Myxococcales bacterium]|nr:hypothetical protein [Myxococcales bacterium]